MSRVDRYPLPSEEEFDVLANRYIVVPGALWGVAILIAIVTAMFQPSAPPTVSATPAPQTAVSILAA